MKPTLILLAPTTCLPRNASANPPANRLNMLITCVLSLSMLPCLARAQAPGSPEALPSAPSAIAHLTAQEEASSRSTEDTGSARSRPNATKETWLTESESFVPMSNRERLADCEYSLVGPQALLYSAGQAGVGQLRNVPQEWGQGAAGFGKRYASSYGQHLIHATVSSAVAFGLHEDNRYFKSDKTGIGRLSYAITSSFLARHDDGRRFISVSAITGAAAGAFISRAWQPPSTSSMSSAAVSFGVALAVNAGINCAREFLPNRLERFLK